MRIRTFKPEFWSDEKTGTLSMQAALLFLAMFNFADDKGRLRGVPSLLKAQAFPYRPEIDIEATLNELLVTGLVRAYKVGGQSYLEIKNFLKHQRINRPSDKNLMPEPQVYEITELHEGSMNTHGGLSEGSVSVHGGLSEDSVRAHCRKGKEGKGRERKGLQRKTTLSAQNSPTYEFQKLWNEKAHENLPRVQAITPKRQKAIQAFGGIERFGEVLTAINESTFLTCQFKATFDWVLKPENALKILEGNYRNDRQNKPFPSEPKAERPRGLTPAETAEMRKDQAPRPIEFLVTQPEPEYVPDYDIDGGIE